jgi:hypothetical protein
MILILTQLIFGVLSDLGQVNDFLLFIHYFPVLNYNNYNQSYQAGGYHVTCIANHYYWLNNLLFYPWKRKNTTNTLLKN